MEQQIGRGIADAGQNHPRMNREQLARTTGLQMTMTATELRAPGMAPALLSKIFQFEELYDN
jgi:hypothetical protein